jgi:hypothetical protein
MDTYERIRAWLEERLGVVSFKAEGSPSTRLRLALGPTVLGGSLHADVVLPGEAERPMAVIDAGRLGRFRVTALGPGIRRNGRSLPEGVSAPFGFFDVIGCGRTVLRRPNARLAMVVMSATGVGLALVFASGLSQLNAKAVLPAMSKATAGPAPLPTAAAAPEQPAEVEASKALTGAFRRLGFELVARPAGPGRLEVVGDSAAAKSGPAVDLTQSIAARYGVAVAGRAPPAPAEPSIKFRSVFVQPSPLAILVDGRKVRPGDEVSHGWILEAIRADGVHLRRGVETRLLHL